MATPMLHASSETMNRSAAEQVVWMALRDKAPALKWVVDFRPLQQGGFVVMATANIGGRYFGRKFECPGGGSSFSKQDARALWEAARVLAQSALAESKAAVL